MDILIEGNFNQIQGPIHFVGPIEIPKFILKSINASASSRGYFNNLFEEALRSQNLPQVAINALFNHSKKYCIRCFPRNSTQPDIATCVALEQNSIHSDSSYEKAIANIQEFGVEKTITHPFDVPWMTQKGKPYWDFLVPRGGDSLEFDTSFILIYRKRAFRTPVDYKENIMGEHRGKADRVYIDYYKDKKLGTLRDLLVMCIEIKWTERESHLESEQ
jgi:hypothetical protein